jgi:hypothetical protein
VGTHAMTDRTTLLKLIEGHVERTDGVEVIERYHNRVTFETDGETVGLPPSLSHAIADASGRICGSGGNKFSVRVSPQ